MKDGSARKEIVFVSCLDLNDSGAFKDGHSEFIHEIK